jgi:hypothetical protein
VEVPRVLPAPRTYTYGYSVDVPPRQVKDERRYSTYDYQLQVHRKNPAFAGGSYDYKLEVPPAPKEKPKYSFNYELHVSRPKPHPKT